MKIRTGFVSNSSSSSFIIALAKIGDVEKFQGWLSELRYIDENKKLNYAMVFIDSKDLDKDVGYLYTFNGKEICVESFNYDSIKYPTDATDNTKFFIVDITNDEGDASFSDINGDLNYDISEDYFEGSQRKLLDLESAPGVEYAKVIFGAGRNG